MSIILNIANSCINCGKCAQVCPAQIFVRKFGNEPKIKIEHVENCISCGHCLDICPTNSIEHSEFNLNQVHPIDYTKMATPEQMMLLLKARRSNRAFSNRPIPSEMLDMILEAAHLAPTARNLQQVHFTLVTNPEKLNLITDMTLNTFASMIKKLESSLLKPILKLTMPKNYEHIPYLKHLISEREKQYDPILREATAVLLIHTPTDNQFGSKDANLAYQNASLMAETLGVSQFYTGYVCAATQADKNNSLAKALGINGTIHAGMALGLPVFRYPNYVDRKEIQVNRIE